MYISLSRFIELDIMCITIQISMNVLAIHARTMQLALMKLMALLASVLMDLQERCVKQVWYLNTSSLLINFL